MTVDGFRRLALSMPESSEVGHMGHPDFRVGGKIFATLGYPDRGWAVVKLTPEQQEAAAWRNVAPRKLVGAEAKRSRRPGGTR